MKNPGPRFFALVCAAVFAAIVSGFVAMSPNEQEPRKLRVLALTSASNLLAGGTLDGVVRIGTSKALRLPASSSQRAL
jgi:hypothetical protein